MLGKRADTRNSWAEGGCSIYRYLPGPHCSLFSLAFYIDTLRAGGHDQLLSRHRNMQDENKLTFTNHVVFDLPCLFFFSQDT